MDHVWLRAETADVTWGSILSSRSTDLRLNCRDAIPAIWKQCGSPSRCEAQVHHFQLLEWLMLPNCYSIFLHDKLKSPAWPYMLIIPHRCVLHVLAPQTYCKLHAWNACKHNRLLDLRSAFNWARLLPNSSMHVHPRLNCLWAKAKVKVGLHVNHA